MRLKVFTLRMKPETGAFDDKELSDFQPDKDAIESWKSLAHGTKVWADNRLENKGS